MRFGHSIIVRPNQLPVMSANQLLDDCQLSRISKRMLTAIKILPLPSFHSVNLLEALSSNESNRRQLQIGALGLDWHLNIG